MPDARAPASYTRLHGTAQALAHQIKMTKHPRLQDDVMGKKKEKTKTQKRETAFTTIPLHVLVYSHFFSFQNTVLHCTEYTLLNSYFQIIEIFNKIYQTFK